MSWSSGVRQVHRWTALVFAVLAISVVVITNTMQGEPAEWVYVLPLLPLAVLFFTGLYLFILPYTRRRGGRTSHG